MYPHSYISRAALLVALAALAVPTAASAVDRSVAAACAGDYLALCSEHDPDGPGVRKCFRVKGASLSNRCVNALVAAGEISKEEVARKSTRR